MAAYYFHCTDGYDLIVDRRGRRFRSIEAAERMAYAVAGAMMQGAPGSFDWSRWLVSVMDESGSLVAVVPFPAGQA